MMLPLLMFLIGSGTVLGAYAAVTYLPDFLARRQLDKRLSDISTPFSLGDGDESSIVKQKEEGPLPAVERLVARTNAGSGLKKLTAAPVAPTGAGTDTRPSAASVCFGYTTTTLRRVNVSQSS